MAIKRSLNRHSAAYPQDDLVRVQLWCREILPEEEWEQRQVFAEHDDRHITIVEMRRDLSRDGRDGHPWTRIPVARLRFQTATRRWHLDWRGYAMGFQEYKAKWPARSVQSLLDFLATTTDPVFWE